MSQDNGPCWDHLPSIIMLKIFSYLEPKDRINASMVCKNWRQALFHPLFWKNITFVVEDRNTCQWSRYLADCFALSVESATVKCQIAHRSVEVEKLLENFRRNRNLRKLFIEPSSSAFEGSFCADDEDDIETWTKSIYDSIFEIIKNTRRLEALTLGYVEDLTANAANILEYLSQHHSKHITHLSLASVKEDPEHYKIGEFDKYIFNNFKNLTFLTIDYDYLSDQLLDSFTSGTLERLVVHVHNWKKDHCGTTNRKWQTFTKNNPRCEMRCNFIHAYSAIDVIHNAILKSAMPLTHFKALFCERVSVSALYALVAFYYHSLRSIMWIDSRNADELLPPTDAQSNPDGLVFVAWRCPHLEELVYIGHKYYQENILAIARLRGATLKKFEFAKSNIISEDDTPYRFEETRCEIDYMLGDKWKIYTDKELLPVLLDPIAGDSRDLIMPLILDDAK